MNNLSKDWLVKAIAIALVSSLVGGGFLWAQSTSKVQNENREDISVQASRLQALKEVQAVELQSIREKVEDVKESQRRIENKLDRVLEKR